MTYWENKFVNPIKSKARIVDSEGNFSTGNLLDYIDIHRYTMKAGLSNSEGNSLLALIQKICIRHSARITIPTDMRAINAAITNSSESHHSCLEVIIPYPVGLLDIEHILPVKGYFLNPLYVLAEYLTQLSEEDLVLRPEFNVTTEGVPIIDHYTSAEQFKAICNQVSDMYGTEVFPLCLSVNYDSMALETTGKRSCKPLKMSILNVKGHISKKASNVHTIAFGPDLPYTDNQVSTLLGQAGVSSNTKIGLATRYLKRYGVYIIIIRLYSPL